MTKLFIGIDMGATNIKIGCFDSESEKNAFMFSHTPKA